MKKIGDVTSTADKNGEWTNGNVAAGIPPTILESGWLNSVQREILNVLLKAGVPQDKNKDDQLADAIGKIITKGIDGKLTKDQNGADIPDKPKFIENLGLKEQLKAKVDYANHTITGGVDAAGNGSVNAANGALRFYRKTDGTVGIYSRSEANDTSDYKLEALFPFGKGEVCIDVFTFAAGGVKYRDVKSQRKNNVTYTNSLPRPILVIASYDSPATRTLAYVDGIRVAQTSHGSPSATGAWGGFVSFIVPAGSKYVVNSNGDKIELLDWVEL